MSKNVNIPRFVPEPKSRAKDSRVKTHRDGEANGIQTSKRSKRTPGVSLLKEWGPRGLSTWHYRRALKFGPRQDQDIGRCYATMTVRTYQKNVAAAEDLQPSRFRQPLLRPEQCANSCERKHKPRREERGAGAVSRKNVGFKRTPKRRGMEGLKTNKEVKREGQRSQVDRIEIGQEIGNSRDQSLPKNLFDEDLLEWVDISDEEMLDSWQDDFVIL